MKNIEIVEIGYPQSIIKRENEPISLIGTEYLVSQFQNRINELEQTIENMKAIAGEKIEPVGGITSVDYQSDNETELIDSPYSSVIGQWLITKCCSFLIKDNFNYCPNCGRKIKK